MYACEMFLFAPTTVTANKGVKETGWQKIKRMFWLWQRDLRQKIHQTRWGLFESNGGAKVGWKACVCMCTA